MHRGAKRTISSLRRGTNPRWLGAPRHLPERGVCGGRTARRAAPPAPGRQRSAARALRARPRRRARPAAGSSSPAAASSQSGLRPAPGCGACAERRPRAGRAEQRGGAADTEPAASHELTGPAPGPGPGPLRATKTRELLCPPRDGAGRGGTGLPWDPEGRRPAQVSGSGGPCVCVCVCVTPAFAGAVVCFPHPPSLGSLRRLPACEGRAAA